MAHWPSVARGREGPGALRDYLKGLDSGAPATVVEAPAATGGRFFYSEDLSDFNFNQRQGPLAQALDRMIEASAARMRRGGDPDDADGKPPA